MTLTLRNTKGSALTHAELDGNFTYIDSTKGSPNWSGQATRTASFNSVPGVWQEVEITGAGNIIGTLPVSPVDNEEHLFYCRATATDPGGRFRLGLNGKVINGRADTPTQTRSTSFNAGTIAASFAEIGGSIVLGGSTGYIELNTNSIFARTGNNSLKVGDYDNGSSNISWTLPTVATGQSNLTLYALDHVPWGSYPEVLLNGTLIYQWNSSNAWDTISVNLSQSSNTLVLRNKNNDNAYFDDITLTGILVNAPASWTDVVPWQLNSGGRLAVRWNSIFQSWAVLDYYKGIYA